MAELGASVGRFVVALVAAAAWVSACGGTGDPPAAAGGSSAGGAGPGGGSPGGAGPGGATGGGNGGSGAFISTDGASTGGTSNLGDAACATETFQGEQIPLDMYIMMDRSGSMGQATAAGPSVWDATKQAITDFVNSPDSSGIGVGIQFFPPSAGSMPACGPFTPPPCPVGCMAFGPFCVPDSGGSCNLNDYLPPAVGIQPLPGVAPQIVTALNGQSPGGGTPTLPAMQSAAQASTVYAQQNPGRKLIIVLATDGNPNDCNSTIPAVANVAAAAAMGAPPVNTFVIGIGNIMGLDQIAAAGGTGQALVVNPATAGQDFLDAMNKIRGQALTCAFKIPTPPTGEQVNLQQVNVRYTAPGSSTSDVVYNVASEADCDPVLGGWYYDDPANPKEIRTCPATCDLLEVGQGRVDVQLGCDTIKIPK